MEEKKKKTFSSPLGTFLIIILTRLAGFIRRGPNLFGSALQEKGILLCLVMFTGDYRLVIKCQTSTAAPPAARQCRV